MRKIITFGQYTAILERSNAAALLEVTPSSAKLTQLADKIDYTDNIEVHAVLPARGKIAFTVDKETSTVELLDIVCDAITRVFDTDTVISK